MRGLPKRRFGLPEPVGHAHVAEHRRRRRQAVGRALARAGERVQLAEAQVAARGERAHPELVGHGQRVVEVSLGRVQETRVAIARRPDLRQCAAEEMKRPGLVPSLALGARERACALANPYGLGFFTEPCSAAQPCGFATRAQLPSSV
jgi:hypothetical protein